MSANFCGVVHEAVFDITDGPDKGQVVRLRCSDSDEAERMSPLVTELLNNPAARVVCSELHEALTLYLDESESRGVELVKRAAAVANYIHLLRRRQQEFT